MSEYAWMRENPAEKIYSKSEPVASTIFRQRGAAVVCHCKHSDGFDKAAKLDRNGTVYICADESCGFEWLAADALKAPLPHKSYGGPDASAAVRAAVAEQTTNRSIESQLAEIADMFDDEPEPEDTTDGAILNALQVCGFNTQRSDALAFGRYVCDTRKISPSLWSNPIIKTQWTDFDRKRKSAAA